MRGNHDAATLSEAEVSRVAGGVQHTAVLQRSGEIVTFGRMDDANKPRETDADALLACGYSYTMCSSNAGLCVWGRFNFNFTERAVSSISAGHSHFAFIAERNA
jgi:hypothetical protein